MQLASLAGQHYEPSSPSETTRSDMGHGTLDHLASGLVVISPLTSLAGGTVFVTSLAAD